MNVENKYLKKKLKNAKIFSKIINVNLDKNYNLIKKIKNPYFFTAGNQENLSFVFSIGKQLNLQNKKIIRVANKFKGLKFRQEIVYSNDKITIINDSKATSFASSINILKSLNRVFWLVGGVSKLGDQFSLSKKECKNIYAYIYGKKRNFFVKQFKNKIVHYSFKNLNSALKQILIDTKKDNIHKTILFSPSAASFDSFKNFEERGNYFNSLLKKYKVKRKFNVNK